MIFGSADGGPSASAGGVPSTAALSAGAVGGPAAAALSAGVAGGFAAAAQSASAAGGSAAAAQSANSAGDSGSASKKRKASDEEINVMAGLTGAVNRLADAFEAPVIVQTSDVHPDLYSLCMGIPGFSDEDLMTALTYLLDNKSQGDGFVKFSADHRVLWLRQFLAKI